MTYRYYIMLLLGLSLNAAGLAQQRVGVNTTTPVRPLEIYGSGTQYLRLGSSTALGSQTGLELIRGDQNAAARDWKLENNGAFRIQTGSDNFSTAGEEILRINGDGYMGIGTTAPVTRLHIEGGEQASNTSDGYLMIGSKTANNMVMDQNGIIARLNGNPATLYIQTGGGNTWFGSGNVYMGSGGGKINIGDSPLNGRFNIDGSSFQMYLRNDLDGANDWYIGASSSSWQTGDDQLLFSPTSGHLNSTLRLRDVAENDGIVAPVAITSPSTQSLLFDGNEIESNTPLYINHNSDENTFINPSGGKVGVGTSNPDGYLHIKTSEYGLGLQRDFATWWIDPVANGNINFFKNTELLAYVSFDGGGEWVAVSDRNLKENIQPFGTVMERINQIRPSSYSFIHDPNSTGDIGVIAQELEPLFPEAVSFTNDQYGVSYDQLTVVAIKGIQEQQAQLEKLSMQIDRLLSE